MIVCNLNESAFIHIDFYKLLVVDSNTEQLKIENPKNLYWTREIISSLLMNQSEGNPEKISLALLVKQQKQMCWKEWREFSKSMSKEIFHWVISILNRYPESHLKEAFNNEITLN